MIDNRKLDWMYLLGLHDTVTFIDTDRTDVYNSLDRYLKVREILLSDFAPRSK